MKRGRFPRAGMVELAREDGRCSFLGIAVSQKAMHGHQIGSLSIWFFSGVSFGAVLVHDSAVIIVYSVFWRSHYSFSSLCFYEVSLPRGWCLTNKKHLRSACRLQLGECIIPYSAVCRQIQLFFLLLLLLFVFCFCCSQLGKKRSHEAWWWKMDRFDYWAEQCVFTSWPSNVHIMFRWDYCKSISVSQIKLDHDPSRLPRAKSDDRHSKPKSRGER